MQPFGSKAFLAGGLSTVIAPECLQRERAFVSAGGWVAAESVLSHRWGRKRALGIKEERDGKTFSLSALSPNVTINAFPHVMFQPLVKERKKYPKMN